MKLISALLAVISVLTLTSWGRGTGSSAYASPTVSSDSLVAEWNETVIPHKEGTEQSTPLWGIRRLK
jgi:hypothetical protein